MFGFERRVEKIAPVDVFARRMLISFGIALSIITVSLAIGVAGYHWLGKLPWLDAFMEACMILGGMGPLSQNLPPAAKIFASFYALYSGLILIANMGILLAPVGHRVLHAFHIDKADED